MAREQERLGGGGRVWWVRWMREAQAVVGAAHTDACLAWKVGGKPGREELQREQSGAHSFICTHKHTHNI